MSAWGHLLLCDLSSSKALTRAAKGDVCAADLPSALMPVKCSPPPPTSRQLDSGHSIYAKCSNYSGEDPWVRSIMDPLTTTTELWQRSTPWPHVLFLLRKLQFVHQPTERRRSDESHEDNAFWFMNFIIYIIKPDKMFDLNHLKFPVYLIY